MKPPIALSGLILCTPSGAFLLNQHLPHSSALVSLSRPADSTPSALSVKEGVSDAEIIETTKADLDVSSFLNDMEEDIEGISTLKEAAGIGTLLPDEKGDIYIRAVAKLEAIARDSINRHKAEMEDFNNEIDNIAAKNELDAKTRKNGPIIAFSFLALAIGCGMVATAPEAIYGIDLAKMPVVNVTPFVDRAKSVQEAISPQISDVELPTSVDISSLKEAAANKVADDQMLAEIEPIFQQNLGIPL